MYTIKSPDPATHELLFNSATGTIHHAQIPLSRYDDQIAFVVGSSLNIEAHDGASLIVTHYEPVLDSNGHPMENADGDPLEETVTWEGASYTFEQVFTDGIWVTISPVATAKEPAPEKKKIKVFPKSGDTLPDPSAPAG